jgi:hypothetical protein
MHEPPACSVKLLAQGPCADVTRCACGHVRLTVGPVTVRLEEEVFRALFLTMLEAMEALSRKEEPRPGCPETSQGDAWKQ